MSRRPSKKPKDLKGPKKAQSSYFIFSNERRPVLQEQNPDLKITQVSKLISSEWRNLTDEQKSVYDKLAKEQKQEYNIKFEEYKKTNEYQEYLTALKQWEQNESDRKKAMKKNKYNDSDTSDSDDEINNNNNNNNRQNKKKMSKKSNKKKFKLKQPKKPKQPEDMPKRPQSSYFIFSNERRPELRIKYGTEKKITELAKMISEEWKTKTNEEKKIYEERAAELKKKYDAKMNEYKKSEKYNEFMESVKDYKKAKKDYERRLKNMDYSDDDDSNDMYKVSLPRKPKDENCPKRPLSSYFIFANENRPKFQQENPMLKITEISRLVSAKWKGLTDDDKKPYTEQAATLKAQYNQDMDAYKASESFKQYQERLKEWNDECKARKKKAREKVKELKLKEQNRIKNLKLLKLKNKLKQKKKSKYESDSDQDSDDSDSSNSSSSDDYSGSSSDSASQSGSDDSSSDISSDNGSSSDSD